MVTNDQDNSAPAVVTNSMPDNVVPQAPIDVEQVSTNVQQTLAFHEDTPSADVIFEAPSDPTFTGDSIDVGSLSTFLHRPVKIHEYNWTESAPLPLSGIDPWFLFFNNPTIKKKIDNYGLVCCNLHVKAVINASPFYYGALLMSYQPKPLFSNSINAPAPISHIAYSQRPHVWLLPHNNQGGEMELPFFHERNWLRLTSATQVTNMGKLHFNEVIPLQNANGVTGSTINVQVYAWASNVKLSAPTYELALQSGASEAIDNKDVVIDEYGTGPISRPASAVAYVASLLTKVPIIGRFATATEIGAGAVSRVASIFGWTDVPVIDNVHPVKNLPFQSITSGGIGEPVTKLVLDPKCELSVDPRTVGLTGGDELSIRYLVQRESFLASANWSDSDASETILFNAAVHPSMFDSISQGNSNRLLQLVPMALIAQMFQYWRGDIIFRFKMVCSQYHRGRIRITWDPFGDISSNSDTTTTSFNKIVDISPDLDVEVRCKYSQDRHWLDTKSVEIMNQQDWSVSGQPLRGIVDPESTNGTLTVRVLNELSSPVATSTIQLMVFARGCADTMQFMGPETKLSRRMSYYSVQSGDWITTGSSHDMANEPSTDHPEAYRVYGGEAIGSIRTLLRRAHYEPFVSFQPFGNSTQPDVQFFNVFARRIPQQPGFAPQATARALRVLGPGTVPYSFSRFTPFTLIVPCFAGHRGSMIWHYNLDCTSGRQQQTARFQANRHTGLLPRGVDPTIIEEVQISEYTSATSGTSSIDGYTAFYADNTLNGSAGMALTNTTTQTGLSVSYPMYAPVRFHSNRLEDWPLGSSNDKSDFENTVVTFEMRPERSGSNNGTSNPYAKTQPEDYVLGRMVSIGTDFNAYFFLNVPPLHRYEIPPVPDLA